MEKKVFLVMGIVVVLLAGCQQELTTHTISGTQDLVLDEQDLQQLGMTNDADEQNLEQLGLNGTNCKTEEQTAFDLSMVHYSVCSYVINSLNDTQVIIELKKFINSSELDGAYQYDSSHLYSIEGLISENDYGDKSRFRVNNEHDYGGQYDPPGVYYYHLWICKNEYLIHITSGGRNKEAEGYIAKIGQQILTKFG
ncbi:MAG: hypothetical protein FJY77_02635 [Candidatus Altiarchaeales archaeon]|nr:hypothetical protein [Candidatus Altiarchaeales archaeon]